MSHDDKPLPYSKVVEQDHKPLGITANSSTFYRSYDALLIGRVSDADTWPYDPVEDEETMRLFQEGRTVQYDRPMASPIEAAGLYSQALRRRKDFARAWLDLSVARIQSGELKGAEEILTMLIDKVERTEEMRMTRRARHMMHFNFGFLQWLYSEASQGKERQRYLERADHEFAIADELNDFVNSGDLFNRLVVQVELGRVDEQKETVNRINAYLETHGAQAREVAQDYIAKYARQLNGIEFNG